VATDTIVVIEPGSNWPSQVGSSENLVVRWDKQGLLRSTRRRLDLLRRQGRSVRVAVLACNDATDVGSVARRAEVAHELLGAVASMASGLLVLSSTGHVSPDVRRQLLSLAGALSCRLEGALATVSVRFGAARGGPEAIPDSTSRRVFPGPSKRGASPSGRLLAGAGS
jgi:hypothetical protein